MKILFCGKEPKGFELIVCCKLCTSQMSVNIEEDCTAIDANGRTVKPERTANRYALRYNDYELNCPVCGSLIKISKYNMINVKRFYDEPDDDEYI